MIVAIPSGHMLSQVEVYPAVAPQDINGPVNGQYCTVLYQAGVKWYGPIVMSVQDLHCFTDGLSPDAYHYHEEVISDPARLRRLKFELAVNGGTNS